MTNEIKDNASRLLPDNLSPQKTINAIYAIAQRLTQMPVAVVADGEDENADYIAARIDVMDRLISGVSAAVRSAQELLDNFQEAGIL